MGLDIILKGVDLSAIAIEFLPPVTRGLRAWCLAGGSAADTVKNRFSAGAGDATVVGAPIFQPSYASALRSSDTYLQTPVAETDSMTLALAFRVPGATASNPTADLSANASRPMMMGNQGAGGVSLYVSGTPGLPGATLTAGAFTSVNSVPAIQLAQLNVADITGWHFATAVIEAGVSVRLTDHTTAQSAIKTAVDARVKNTVIPNIRFGSAGRTDFQALHDIAFAAIANVAWTDAERAQVYASAKATLATRGVTI